MKTAAASRQRRLQLQTSYGQAMMWSKGFACGGNEDRIHPRRGPRWSDPQRAGAVCILLGCGSVIQTRGESHWRETAEAIRREAEAPARTTETVVADTYLGLTCLLARRFHRVPSRSRASAAIYDPVLEREAESRFGLDSGPVPTPF